jgi:alginate O-acetyltransferase complex protein AlgI
VLFSSYIFILAYLPVAFAGFAWLRRTDGKRAATLWVVAASAVFYGWWSLAHLALLIGLLVVNFAAGNAIHRRRGTSAGRSILICGVTLNIGVLAWFKYAGFLGAVIAPETTASWRLADIVLPLAISFFTFQKIAYLVDVWRGDVDPPDFAEFCFFVLFFPQLIAGPIVHCRDIVPQIRRPDWPPRIGLEAAAGLSLFAVGLVKKAFLADPLSVAADRVFGAVAAGGAISAGEGWLGTLSFGFQIYFDFSAYSDMALGLALMFGIRLPANFDSPYKASDPIDFWRRWHISLSTWLRDYLYIPLGGNRVPRWRRAMNIAVVMVLGGFWHGAAWTFLLWGAMHAALILSAHSLRAVFGMPGGVARIAISAGTFVAVMICWVPFRATDLTSTLAIFKALFDVGSASISGLPSRDLAILALAAAICWGLPSSMQIFGWRETAGKLSARMKWRPNLVWSSAIATAILAALAYVPTGAPFIYFQF